MSEITVFEILRIAEFPYTTMYQMVNYGWDYDFPSGIFYWSAGSYEA